MARAARFIRLEILEELVRLLLGRRVESEVHVEILDRRVPSHSQGRHDRVRCPPVRVDGLIKAAVGLTSDLRPELSGDRRLEPLICVPSAVRDRHRAHDALSRDLELLTLSDSGPAESAGHDDDLAGGHDSPHS